jgi:hypothetical protein
VSRIEQTAARGRRQLEFNSLTDAQGRHCAAQASDSADPTVTRRDKMQIAMSNALALMNWREFRFLQNFSSRDLAWLVIGVLLAMGVMFLLSRQRRRWF